MFLPAGSRDEMGLAVSNRFLVMERFRMVATLRGYKQIATPVIEYASTFTNKNVDMKLQNMMKWFNSEGEIEVLRPDWTIAIARALSNQEKQPQKWAYQGSVFKRNMPGVEYHQAGVEILHMLPLMGEFECLLTAHSFLGEIGITDYVIELGHTDLYETLVAEINLPEEEAERLRLAMHDKKKDEVYNIAMKHGGKEIANEMTALVDAYGDVRIIDEYIKRWEEREVLLDVLQQLKKLALTIQKAGGGEILVDLGRVKNLPYYSGTMFRGFLKNTGAVCFSGGRYDKLYERYNKDVSAVGLAFDVDVLAEQVQDDTNMEKVCIIADDDSIVYAENIRKMYENCIVDIQSQAPEDGKYDKVVEIKQTEGKYEVFER